MQPCIARCVFYITNEMQLIKCSLLYQRCTSFGRFSAHHQELIKLYVQPWLLSCIPAVYSWCGWVGTVQLKLLMMGGKNARNMYSVDNNKEHCISCISLVV